MKFIAILPIVFLASCAGSSLKLPVFTLPDALGGGVVPSIEILIPDETK